MANVSDIGLKNFLKGAQRDRDCRGRSIKRLSGGGVSSSVAPKRGQDLAEADERANNIVKDWHQEECTTVADTTSDRQ